MSRFGFEQAQVPDLRRIRLKLRRGDLRQIAEELKITPRMVGEVFEHGWHDQYKAAVVASALQLIKGSIDGQKQLTGMAKSLNLTTTNLQSIPYQRKKTKGLLPKGGSRLGRKQNYIVLAVIAVGAFLILGGKKLFANNQ